VPLTYVTCPPRPCHPWPAGAFPRFLPPLVTVRRNRGLSRTPLHEKVWKNCGPSVHYARWAPSGQGFEPTERKKIFSKKFPSRKGRENFFCRWGAQRARIGGDHAGTTGIVLVALRRPGSVGIALVPRGSRWRCSEGRDRWRSRWYHRDRVGGAQRAGISGDHAGTAGIVLVALRGPGSVSSCFKAIYCCHVSRPCPLCCARRGFPRFFLP
jgi:hypothetical protein